MEIKLYVGNLPYTTTEEDLRLLFAQAGNVTEVALVKDRRGGRPKGFGFVTMDTQADAEKAIEMFNAYSIADRELTVQLAKAREAPGGDTPRRSPSAPRSQKANPRKSAEPDGYQSRLSAFAPSGQRSNTRNSTKPSSGYQSRLSAFGNGSTPAASSRRGGQRSK